LNNYIVNLAHSPTQIIQKDSETKYKREMQGVWLVYDVHENDRKKRIPYDE